MSKETSKNSTVESKNKMLEFLKCQQNTQDAYSLFSACVNKEGYFRQSINSCRVNKSSRTVCTGNPTIHSWQCVCPQFIAENIYIPVHVNAQNLIPLKKMMLNYPNYPCIQQLKSNNKNFTIIINPYNNKKLADELKLGDIVYRQIITNDLCMTNRHPSIREESFGSHVVIVNPHIKCVQFNLQVVKKMNADFDGDELQLYFFSQISDNTEIAILSSMPRQLITYETGQSLIGGCPELKFMIFNFKQQNKLYIIDNIIQKYFGNITFNSSNIQIIDGKIQKLTDKLVSMNSQFIASISHYYAPSRVIAFMDEIINTGYILNKQSGSTLYSKVFAKINIQEYQQNLLNNLQQILNQNDQQQEQKYRSMLNNGMIQQLEQIQNTIKLKEDVHYNLLVDDYIDQLRAGKIHLGQMYQEDGNRIISKYRSLPLYKKFEQTPQSQGFVTKSYIQGLDAESLFYDTIPGRYQLYKKGNMIARDGYTTRCVSKGMENVYMSYNNIIYGDGNYIISLTYLYDPRRYCKKVYKKQEIYSRIQNLNIQKKQKDSLTQYFEKTQKYTIYDKIQDQITFIIPLEIQQEKITVEQLNNILSCRLTSNMTEIMQNNILFQTYPFYLYCLLFMDIINEQQKEDICQLYLQTLCPPGETVGIKTALATTEPNSQDTLNSIHSSKLIGQVELDQTIGGVRLSELVMGKSGPTIVYFKLFDCFDTHKFIRDYQQQSFQTLQVKYSIYQQNQQYFMELNLEIEILARYNVIFQKIIDILQQNKKIKIVNILINVNTDANTNVNANVAKTITIIITSEQQQLLKIKYENVKIGCQHLSNMIMQNDYIVANLTTDKIDYIYTIKEINPDTIYINNPEHIQQLSGIFATRQILYNELRHNLSTIEVTKEVQPTHVKLLSDVMTKDGLYQIFSRTNYKKQIYKDVISLSLFEQGDMFISNSLQQTQYYNCDSSLLSVLFGSKSNCGSNVSTIVIDK